MKQLKQDVQLTLVSRIPVMMLSFLSVVFLTRLLGPEGNGVYTFSMAVLNLFFTVVGFQLESGLPVFLAKQKEDAPKVFSSTLFLAMCSFLVFVLLLTVIVFVIPDGEHFVIPPGQSVLFFFSFLIIAFALRRMTTFVQGTLRGTFSFRLFNIMVFLNQLLPALGYGTLLLISISTKQPSSLTTYFGWILGFEFILALTGLIILWRQGLVSFSKDITSYVKPISKLSSQSLLSSSGHFLNKRLDVWFVQFFRGTSSLGQYGLATQVANFISDAMTPFSQVLIPYVAGSPENEHKVIVERSARINMTIAFVAATGIASTSWFFIPFFFGKQFAEAIPATQVLALGVIFISQRLVFTGYFKAINAMQYAVKAAWAGVVMTILLDLLLIPSMGILGAAIATSLAYGTTSVYLVMMAGRKLGFQPGDILIIRKDDINWILQKKRKTENDK